ncbi:hypothetical protein OV203_34195 [Nannocystis sp. ILAH1]|uniref:hypothetical protein n=2 Tax=unclassified Nannocystis TaxID=2627009 RepID=UPI00226DB486|nr:hypothetical protein [Nannocystis sp. ILAH1]MCY0992239.1 hypothetical protein [Nannocystis sp. ILAH1]
MSHLRSHSPPLCLLVLAAALPSACVLDYPVGNTPQSTATGETEPTSTPTTGGTDTATNPTQMPTGGPLMCADFLSDQDFNEMVSITITNAGDTPVWLESVGCAKLPALQITDAKGLDHYFVEGDCAAPLCDELLQGVCERGCEDCGGLPKLRLDPGARFALNWAGADAEVMQMPAECAPGEGCAGECVAARTRPAGVYDITVTAFHGCLGACECEPPSPGSHCKLTDAVVLSEPQTRSEPLSFPDTVDIEILIGG